MMKYDMSYGSIGPRILVDVRKGPTIHIDCGDLLEVPKWLEDEIEVIKARLDAEIKENRAKALNGQEPPPLLQYIEE